MLHEQRLELLDSHPLGLSTAEYSVVSRWWCRAAPRTAAESRALLHPYGGHVLGLQLDSLPVLELHDVTAIVAIEAYDDPVLVVVLRGCGEAMHSYQHTGRQHLRCPRVGSRSRSPGAAEHCGHHSLGGHLEAKAAACLAA